MQLDDATGGAEMLAATKSPIGQLEDREELKQVLNLMQSLPNRQRTVLYLRSIEQFSIPAIAATLGISTSAVKTNLSIARKAMRSKWRDAIRTAQS